MVLSQKTTADDVSWTIMELNMFVECVMKHVLSFTDAFVICLFSSFKVCVPRSNEWSPEENLAVAL